MCLVRNITSGLDLECGAEQLAIRYSRCGVPDLDDVKLPLGTDCHSGDAVIVALEN